MEEAVDFKATQGYYWSLQRWFMRYQEVEERLLRGVVRGEPDSLSDMGNIGYKYMDELKYWDKELKIYAGEKWPSQPVEFGCLAVSYFPKKGKVLDLGAGLGLDAVYFSQKGYEVIATDISSFARKEIMARAREARVNIIFKKVDLQKRLPFKNKSFDVVYAHQSLHFFNDKTTKRIVKEVHRILKPDGIFAALFNSTKDPEIKELRKISKDYYCSTRGLTKRFFSVGYMRQIIRGCFEAILLDSRGRTNEDNYRSMIRFVGRKIN